MKRNGISYRVMMLFCSNAILQIMGFIYRMALSRLAGAYVLGVNSLVMQIYGLMVSVCISGLSVAVTAISARLEEDEIGSLLITALISYAALWTLAALPAALLGRVIERSVIKEPGIFKTLLIMLFCIFMTGVENVLKSIHLGRGRTASCAASEMIEQGVRFALVILLLRNAFENDSSDKVFLIMLGMTLSEFVSVSFLSVSYYKLFRTNRKSKKLRFLFRETARIAFPAALTAVSSNAFASFGSLLLPGLLTGYGLIREDAINGIGVLNTVCVPVTMLPMALAGAYAAVIMPEISKMTDRGVYPRKLIRTSFLTVFAFGAFFSILIFLFSDRITTTLFAKTADRTVFAILSLKANVIFAQVLSVAVLNGLMLQKRILLFTILGEAYQLVLVLLLTPALGLNGYCAAMAAGEFIRLALNAAEIRNRSKTYGFCARNMIKSC